MDLETIIANGLCAGCGLCESIAGQARVEMRLTEIGQLRPKVKLALDQVTADLISEICPGIHVKGPDSPPRGFLHPLWGPLVTLHLGWASNPEIRHKAAAGGALTALACHLLTSGAVDAILHVRASATQPLLTDAWVSTTIEEVISAAQSRYGPGAPLTKVHSLLDAGIRFAVIGKPCDIAAIRNLQRCDDRADRLIPFLLTIFCGGVPSLGTARRIVAYHGIVEEEVSLFRWRGNGWPGPTRIETRDGRAFELSYDKVWYSKDVPWTYDIQFRCKICPDAIGELADISCPDGWIMKNGKPIHEEAPGVNVIIARTQKGAELVQSATEAGVLTLEPFTADELDRMHADHIPRKIENPGRLRALGEESTPRPNFANFRDEAMIARAGPERDCEAERKARRRLRAGANREPLP
ncbi:MAG TPA: Coenzyme F420 hydrogenase/dehydrogenase, beta subunit C-terminal domain [Alphaproteobacteria bacterium]|nr:Coenzyme F420 hydrogenase/dehydrogenase, beta subunit C-terminal domain [Alphaproteobacteria bacterium]